MVSSVGIEGLKEYVFELKVCKDRWIQNMKFRNNIRWNSLEQLIKNWIPAY